MWDTGMGIAPEHQQDVFREFHQLGNPERDLREGLGLAIAKGLADTLVRMRAPGLVISDYRLREPRTGTEAIAEVRGAGSA